MFGKSFELFKLFGFPIKIDVSWFIILFLVTWTLALGYFPFNYVGLSTGAYWFMGVIGAIGLFVSIILHEFSHALIARRAGLPIRGITLFIFGGVSEISEEPQSSKIELLMAIAGPISSFIIGGFFFISEVIAIQYNWSMIITGIFGYLAMINLLLGIFNLVPAFPLDGGRVLRSILWAWKKDIRWATRIASRIGSWFGVLLIVLGILSFFSGAIVGGIWWVLIGLFLRGAANAANEQLEIMQALKNQSVRRFMKSELITVPSNLSLEELVNNYFYKYHFKMFPVVDENKLEGCISIDQIKEIPPNQWNQHNVAELISVCPVDKTITPDTDAIKALSMMTQSGNSKLIVTEGNKVVGILTLKDLMEFLLMKIQLERQVA